MLHITQSYWVISGITIQNGQKGVVLDGATHTLLTGIMVAEIGDEGVHFRSNSSDNRLTQSEVRSTGKYQAGFGEGVERFGAHRFGPVERHAPTAEPADRPLRDALRHQPGDRRCLAWAARSRW